MSTWLVYFVVKLDQIQGMFVVLAVFFGLALAIGTISYTINKEKDEGIAENIKKHMLKKIYIAIFLIAFLSAFLMPDSKQTAIIYVLPKIVNNEQVQQIPDSLMRLFDKKMKDWIGEADASIP